MIVHCAEGRDKFHIIQPQNGLPRPAAKTQRRSATKTYAQTNPTGEYQYMHVSVKTRWLTKVTKERTGESKGTRTQPSLLGLAVGCITSIQHQLQNSTSLGTQIDSG